MRWNVAGDMLLNQHKKLAYCAIITASSGLKSAEKRKRLHIANKLPCIVRAIT
jgi:hypothetical protein